MTNTHRLASGGRLDRSQPLTFEFDDVTYGGYQGDTLASALLANGVHGVSTSIHHGRPRGIQAAGVDEPNALVRVHGDSDGVGTEPMTQATVTELYQGLRASSLRGKGRLDEGEASGTVVHDSTHAHCDVLVVGAGPTGLAAARTAAATGARVILLDEQSEMGGDLLGARAHVDDRPAMEWVHATVAELARRTETTVLPRTTALGLYDHNHVVAAERRTRHLGPDAANHLSRERLWLIRARRIVLATGAHERPLLFADNDRPGIMLADAARTYATRYAVRLGQRAVVATNNDSAYPAALRLADTGVRIPHLVDAREVPPPYWTRRCAERGIEVWAGHTVVGSRGEERVSAARVAPLEAPALPADHGAEPVEIPCDLLLVSGGWNPAVHLHTHGGGRTRYDELLCCHVPHEPDPLRRVAGAARGRLSLGDCLADGAAAGADATTDLGLTAGQIPPPPDTDEPAPTSPLWPVPHHSDTPHAEVTYVDQQRDATVAHIERAVGSGMRSVEHIKRYTTIGTAHDQGRTSGAVAAAVSATALGVSVGELGTTAHRPPYTPVSFALLAGRARGVLHEPVRTTPMHGWHRERGAAFEDVGQWKRPRYYPQPGEDMAAAVHRECVAARAGVAVMDASTLGKIEVRGPDAAEFLNRVYTGGFAKLRVGAARYGIMCTTDGMVFDDGVTMRLAEDRFLVSTTTGNAAAVLEWLEDWLQTEWPHLRVFCTSVTEQWATTAVVGPESRQVLSRLAPDLALGREEFPFMAWREAMISGVPTRIARISFSGELAYEINVPSWWGLQVWRWVMEAGEPFGITPYGTETMHVLRAEKGFVIVGQDTDGTVTPQDLGMDWAVSKRKEFIGKRSHQRADTARPDRKHLVGLLPQDPGELLPEGGQVVDPASSTRTDPSAPVALGHVTSSYRSAALDRTFALALVSGGRDRIGSTVEVPTAGTSVPARVTEPVFFDKEGRRRDG